MVKTELHKYSPLTLDDKVEACLRDALHGGFQ